MLSGLCLAALLATGPGGPADTAVIKPATDAPAPALAPQVVPAQQHDTSPPVRDQKAPPKTPERRVHPVRHIPRPIRAVPVPATTQTETPDPARTHKAGTPPRTPRKPAPPIADETK